MEHVVKVRSLTQLRPLPAPAPEIAGLAEEDGENVPVLLTLGQGRSRLVDLQAMSRRFAIPADEVQGVLAATDAPLGPPPAGQRAGIVIGVVGGRGAGALLIDAEALSAQLEGDA